MVPKGAEKECLLWTQPTWSFVRAGAWFEPGLLQFSYCSDDLDSKYMQVHESAETLQRTHSQFIPTVDITPVGNQTPSLSPGGLS